MTEHIHGQPYHNDAEGVAAFGREILARERDRVRRNRDRAEGCYPYDLNQAAMVMERLNAQLFTNLSYDIGPALEEAKREVTAAQAGGFWQLEEVTDPMGSLSNRVRQLGDQLQHDARVLDRIIAHMITGEPESEED